MLVDNSMKYITLVRRFRDFSIEMLHIRLYLCHGDYVAWDILQLKHKLVSALC